MVDTMTIERASRTKRVHSKEFKDEVVRACREPGVSVAGIALANGVNANLVRKWMSKRGVAAPTMRRSIATAPTPRPIDFVPVTLEPVKSLPAIHIEARRRDGVVKIEWPVSAAGECAAWLRDWLK